MKLTLMVEGSASVIAAILANLPEGATVAPPSLPAPIGTGVPVADAPTPTPLAATVAQMPGVVADDDDNGPVDVGAPAVDSSGMPWDERIHAGTKATVADGTWRKKRGVNEAFVTAIEAQLRSQAGSPQPVAAPAPVPAPVPVPPPVAMPAAVPMQPTAMPVTETPPAPMPVAVPAPVPMPAPPMPVAAPEPAPAPAPVEQPAAAAGATPFIAFMTHMSEQMNKTGADGLPLVHADYLAGLTSEISAAFAPQGFGPFGVITDIKDHPVMIDYAIQLMQRDGRW